MGSQPTAERLSLLIGLVGLMLATLPRYVAGGHATRLNLILVALAVVVVVAVANWRMLSITSRQRLPELFKRLGLCLVAGMLGMGAWHAVFSDWLSWQLLLAHGATLGLLLHALWLWVRPYEG
ncbi:hypothetical protein [Halomonas urumqiensis]|uniref:Transmembrane protein n=1 Tax=Halomonas urumqiensis TaxID=1684789 RepID=A0A2N7UPP7_9GAMM|nr:hypothetical protein [Halomonas urumqiensis]PMR82414.1 hypothetical protein C1H70_01455 [Halomonas urumqiensis]PTB04106.1 hypothetical protein C6V82_06545 [Halomonas urumqiensis]GHE19629.1 hypothetical protein GCM10017767_01500 [Halomonas urumqiensis]